MKASSHEKHAKQQLKNNKTKKKQQVQTHGQGLGRGLAGDMGLNFLFFCFVFPWFFAVWPKPREDQTKKFRHTTKKKQKQNKKQKNKKTKKILYFV